MPDATVTAAQFREAVGAEYGQYVATVAIDINGARAFNVGDPVPASHVAGGIVDDGQVSKVSSKAGQAAVASSTASEKG